MSESPAPARSATRSVTIDRPVAEVHAYLADAANWPQWAIINVLAVERSGEPGWWMMATPEGPGEIRIRADATSGVLDHDFRFDPDDPTAIATVPARVVVNGRGAEFLMTIFQPAEVDDDEFDRLLTSLDTELATLKQVLEER
jgi:hypothetical protein